MSLEHNSERSFKQICEDLKQNQSYNLETLALFVAKHPELSYKTVLSDLKNPRILQEAIETFIQSLENKVDREEYSSVVTEILSQGSKEEKSQVVSGMAIVLRYAYDSLNKHLQEFNSAIPKPENISSWGDLKNYMLGYFGSTRMNLTIEDKQWFKSELVPFLAKVSEYKSIPSRFLKLIPEFTGFIEYDISNTKYFVRRSSKEIVNLTKLEKWSDLRSYLIHTFHPDKLALNEENSEWFKTELLPFCQKIKSSDRLPEDLKSKVPNFIGLIESDMEDANKFIDQANEHFKTSEEVLTDIDPSGLITESNLEDNMNIFRQPSEVLRPHLPAHLETNLSLEAYEELADFIASNEFYSDLALQGNLVDSNLLEISESQGVSEGLANELRQLVITNQQGQIANNGDQTQREVNQVISDLEPQDDYEVSDVNTALVRTIPNDIVQYLSPEQTTELVAYIYNNDDYRQIAMEGNLESEHLADISTAPEISLPLSLALDDALHQAESNNHQEDIFPESDSNESPQEQEIQEPVQNEAESTPEEVDLPEELENAGITTNQDELPGDQPQDIDEPEVNQQAIEEPVLNETESTPEEVDLPEEQGNDAAQPAQNPTRNPQPFFGPEPRLRGYSDAYARAVEKGNLDDIQHMRRDHIQSLNNQTYNSLRDNLSQLSPEQIERNPDIYMSSVMESITNSVDAFTNDRQRHRQTRSFDRIRNFTNNLPLLQRTAGRIGLPLLVGVGAGMLGGPVIGISANRAAATALSSLALRRPSQSLLYKFNKFRSNSNDAEKLSLIQQQVSRNKFLENKYSLEDYASGHDDMMEDIRYNLQSEMSRVLAAATSPEAIEVRSARSAYNANREDPEALERYRNSIIGLALHVQNQFLENYFIEVENRRRNRAAKRIAELATAATMAVGLGMFGRYLGGQILNGIEGVADWWVKTDLWPFDIGANLSIDNTPKPEKVVENIITPTQPSSTASVKMPGYTILRGDNLSFDPNGVLKVDPDPALGQFLQTSFSDMPGQLNSSEYSKLLQILGESPQNAKFAENGFNLIHDNDTIHFSDKAYSHLAESLGVSKSEVVERLTSGDKLEKFHQALLDTHRSGSKVFPTWESMFGESGGENNIVKDTIDNSKPVNEVPNVSQTVSKAENVVAEALNTSSEATKIAVGNPEQVADNVKSSALDAISSMKTPTEYSFTMPDYTINTLDSSGQIIPNPNPSIYDIVYNSFNDFKEGLNPNQAQQVVTQIKSDNPWMGKYGYAGEGQEVKISEKTVSLIKKYTGETDLSKIHSLLSDPDQLKNKLT